MQVVHLTCMHWTHCSANVVVYKGFWARMHAPTGCRQTLQLLGCALLNAAAGLVVTGVHPILAPVVGFGRDGEQQYAACHALRFVVGGWLSVIAHRCFGSELFW